MAEDQVIENARLFARSVPMAVLYARIDGTERIVQTCTKALSPHVIPTLETYKEVAAAREAAYLSWIEGTSDDG